MGMSGRKRDSGSSHLDEASRSEPHKKNPHSSFKHSTKDSNGGDSSRKRKKLEFASYLDAKDLPLKIKLLCEIIATTSSSKIEASLDETAMRITQQDVEEVLKLSYGFPASAVKFFRWASPILDRNHSPYSWNLLVDLLGKNSLFDAMWDTVRSMKTEGLVSLATFASVFSSYVIADRVEEAVKTFNIMDEFALPKDTMALNSLLSAICRDGQTTEAADFLGKEKGKVLPDSDSYAILLEGWENEGNVVRARDTVADMITHVGWDPLNLPAYDSFLTLLVKGGFVDEALKFLSLMQTKRCSPGLKFFEHAIRNLVERMNLNKAVKIWETMLANGILPNTELFNLMISLYCYVNQIDAAWGLLDEMVYYGACPNSQTYNVLFSFSIKSKKLKQGSALILEMVKNECVLTQANFEMGLRAFIDAGDVDTAIRLWKHAHENRIEIKPSCLSVFLTGLCSQGKGLEACKYAEDVIDRGFPFGSSLLQTLKREVDKHNIKGLFERLSKKWRR